MTHELKLVNGKYVPSDATHHMDHIRTRVIHGHRTDSRIKNSTSPRWHLEHSWLIVPANEANHSVNPANSNT